MPTWTPDVLINLWRIGQTGTANRLFGYVNDINYSRLIGFYANSNTYSSLSSVVKNYDKIINVVNSYNDVLNITNFIKNNYDKLVNIINNYQSIANTVNFINSNYTKLNTYFDSGVFNKILNICLNNYQVFSDVINLYGTIKNLVSIYTNIKNLTDIYASIKSIVDGFTQPVERSSGTITGISDWAKKLYNLIINFENIIGITGIKNKFATLYNSLSTVYNTLVQDINTLIKNISDGTYQYSLINLINSDTFGIKKAITDINSTLTSMYNNISSTASSIYNVFLSQVSIPDPLTGLTVTFSSSIHYLKDRIVNCFDQAKKSINNAYNAIVKIKDWILNLPSAINSLKNSLIEKISDMIAGINMFNQDLVLQFKPDSVPSCAFSYGAGDLVIVPEIKIGKGMLFNATFAGYHLDVPPTDVTLYSLTIPSGYGATGSFTIYHPLGYFILMARIPALVKELVDKLPSTSQVSVSETKYINGVPIYTITINIPSTLANALIGIESQIFTSAKMSLITNMTYYLMRTASEHFLYTWIPQCMSSIKSKLYNYVKTTINTAISDITTSVPNDLASYISSLNGTYTALNNLFNDLTTNTYNNIHKVIDSIQTMFGNTYASLTNLISTTSYTGIIDRIKDIFNKIVSVFSSVYTIGTNIKSIYTDIQSAIGNIINAVNL